MLPLGFMIASMLMRKGMSLAGALQTFAAFRPKGIYKEEYVRTLYRYYHEPLYGHIHPSDGQSSGSKLPLRN